MNIGITCYPTYGGSGVVATELGKNLAQMGHQVHIIAYAPPYRMNRFQENLYFHEVDIQEYPLFTYPPYSLALASKIVEVAEHQKLQIIHAHYAIPHATSAYLAREILKESNLKVITTLHGTDITLVGSAPSYRRIVQFSIDQSDGVTAVSHFLARETRETFDIEKEIQVIYNFLPNEFMQLDDKTLKDKRRRKKPGDPFIICHISNFRPLKRVRDIIPIIERLAKKFPVKMYMVGDGPERAPLEKMCRERNLCDHFLFLGKQDSVLEILTQADLFLLPSEHESFGLSVLEAMACGVPCITSNAGGISEVNLHEQTGFLAPIGGIDCYVKYISMLLENESLRQKLSQQARKSALQRFAPDKIVPQYVSYYEKIVNGSSNP